MDDGELTYSLRTAAEGLDALRVRAERAGAGRQFLYSAVATLEILHTQADTFSMGNVSAALDKALAAAKAELGHLPAATVVRAEPDDERRTTV